MILDNVPDVDVNAISSEGIPLLSMMISCGAFNAVKCLLRIPNVDVNAKSQYGVPLLILTEHFNYRRRVSALDLMHSFSKRPDLDVNILNYGETALHWAIRWFYPDINDDEDFNKEAYTHCVLGMIEIFSSSLDPNIKDQDGETVLTLSIRRNMKEVALRLLDIPGIDINATNREGINAPLLVMKQLTKSNTTFLDGWTWWDVAQKMLDKKDIQL